jgi:quinolinate synthase
MNICENIKGTEPYKEDIIPESDINEIRHLIEKNRKDILILGHHYQHDDIIAFSDKTGDSFELSRYAEACKDKKYIIFCGVHFMAETADILTDDEQIVILPDIHAGCSMADMAEMDPVMDTYEFLTEKTGLKIIPVTYMNSTADIKAFVGSNGGAVCTSSNAEVILKWAFNQGDAVLFTPDQHLGRNTGYKMGYSLEQMMLIDKDNTFKNMNKEELSSKKIFLWDGFCSVHMNFKAEHIDLMRNKYPDINIIVHPECRFEVVQNADFIGSTSFIVKIIENAPKGTRWAIGTEHHLVNRLAKLYPDKIITTLAPYACQCATMYRVSPFALLKTLKNIDKNIIENRIVVDRETKINARLALDRMLQIK